MKALDWKIWALIIETLVILVAIIVILIRNKSAFKAFIKWVRPSAEGNNNTASGRRLTAFAITVICYIGGTFAFYQHGIQEDIDPQYFLWKFGLDILFIGLLWGFINQQTIVALKNGGFPGMNGENKSPKLPDANTITHPDNENTDEPAK